MQQYTFPDEGSSIWSFVKYFLVGTIRTTSKAVMLAEREVDNVANMQQVRLEESSANVEAARIAMQKRIASAKRAQPKKAA